VLLKVLVDKVGEIAHNDVLVFDIGLDEDQCLHVSDRLDDVWVGSLRGLSASRQSLTDIVIPHSLRDHLLHKPGLELGFLFLIMWTFFKQNVVKISSYYFKIL